jgi:hypothetical protein
MTVATEAQKAARLRNWKVRTLRGLQAQAKALSAERWKRISDIIDEELVEMGALSHDEKYLKDFDEELAGVGKFKDRSK